MHKVEGAPSIMSEATEHTYHGFPGLHGDLTNLSQYVNLDINVEDNKKVELRLVDFDEGDYIWEVRCVDDAGNEDLGGTEPTPAEGTANGGVAPGGQPSPTADGGADPGFDVA